MKKLFVIGCILLLWLVSLAGCAKTPSIDPDAYLPHLLCEQGEVLAALNVSADELEKMSNPNTFQVPNGAEVLGETAKLVLSIGEHDGEADQLLAYHFWVAFEGDDSLDEAFVYAVAIRDFVNNKYGQPFRIEGAGDVYRLENAVTLDDLRLTDGNTEFVRWQLVKMAQPREGLDLCISLNLSTVDSAAVVKLDFSVVRVDENHILKPLG